MKLGKKEKANDFMDALKMETGIEEIEPLTNNNNGGTLDSHHQTAVTSPNERKQSILSSPIKTES